jgi:hypothetical protein
VLANNPKDVQVLHGLGTSVQESGRLADAVGIFQAALALDPNNVAVLHNLANCLRDLGRFDEAIMFYRAALAGKPDHHVCGLKLSAALFYREHWGEAWLAFEARLAIAGLMPPMTMISQTTGAAQTRGHWRGGPQPKSLLVVAEQGLGDTIQFARFLPELAHRYARQLACDRQVDRALRTLDGEIEFAAREGEVRIAGVQAWAPMLSLPLALGLRPGGLAPKSPYLSAEPARVERWRRQLGTHGLKAGIAWQGNPAGDVDGGRSLPLDLFAPLAAIPSGRPPHQPAEGGGERTAWALRALRSCRDAGRRL